MMVKYWEICLGSKTKEMEAVVFGGAINHSSASSEISALVIELHMQGDVRPSR